MELVDSEADLLAVEAAVEFTYFDDCVQENFGQQLNLLRRNREFCDVILQVGQHEIPAHKCVLAVASPRLFQLFNKEPASVIDLEDLDLDFETVEPLVEFAYTFRLQAKPEDVKMLFRGAAKLQMDRVVQACGSYLIEHVTVQNCIGIRSIINREYTADLADQIDTFVRDHFAEASLSPEFIALPRIQIEMLQKSDLEVSQTNEMQLCQMGVDWVRSCILCDDWNIDTMTEKIHLLYLKDEDNTLHDCVEVDEQEKALNRETVVQDYKILSKTKATHKNGKNGKSSRTNSLNRNPIRARQLLFSGNSNSNVLLNFEEFDAKYKVIAVRPTAERSHIALAVAGKRLISLSVVQRVMSQNGSSSGDNAVVAEENSHDQKLLSLADMKTSRCALGAAVYANNIVVAGGYNRGECLSSAEIFDPSTNTWNFLSPMSQPRGRFDIAVLGEQVYAVCGSDGSKDLPTAECYNFESDSWSPIASLSSPRSSAAVCALDDRVICIGGWNGQTVMKAVDAYDPVVDQWLPYAALQTSRSQAGIDVLDGRIYVVGGCDQWDRLNTVEVYDPRTESWNFLPPLQTARRGAGVTQFKGKLYVIGGSDGSQSLCSVEIFDPRLNRWVAGPSLSISRANLEAVELNGRLFAIGGYSGKNFLNSLEILHDDEWSGFI